MTKEQIFNIKNKSMLLIEEDGFQSRIQPIHDLQNSFIINREQFGKHFKKYNFLDMDYPNKMGQFFLYEKHLDCGYRSGIKHDHEIFYPKLGIYLNSLPCDQTIEVEWVDYRRTWEWQIQHEYQHAGKTYLNYIGVLPTEVQRLPLWGDYLLVYGVWDHMPNWKQLKQAYERTWWFFRTEEEKRDLQLNRLLK